jgi:hypothetical protein
MDFEQITDFCCSVHNNGGVFVIPLYLAFDYDGDYDAGRDVLCRITDLVQSLAPIINAEKTATRIVMPIMLASDNWGVFVAETGVVADQWALRLVTKPGTDQDAFGEHAAAIEFAFGVAIERHHGDCSALRHDACLDGGDIAAVTRYLSNIH